MITNSSHIPAWLTVVIPLLVLAALWDGTWKVIGMWKSARNNQLAWFVCIAIFNTMGILPIVYLLCCQADRNVSRSAPPIAPWPG